MTGTSSLDTQIRDALALRDDERGRFRPRRMRASADERFVSRTLAAVRTHTLAQSGDAVAEARASAQEVIGSLTADYDSLRQRFGDLQAETQRIVRARDTVQKGLTTERDGLRDELAEARRELADALQVASIRLSEAEASGRELNALRHSLGKTKLDLAAADGRIERLEAEVSQIRSTWTPPQDEPPAVAPVKPVAGVTPQPVPGSPEPAAAPRKAAAAGEGKGRAAAKRPEAAKP